MDLQLLGPFTATVQGRSVVPEASKPRQVLALLALRADQVVPAQVLLEELWEDTPPPSAMTTLQTYVLQLRKLISTAIGSGAGKDVLCTKFGGYQLRVAPGFSDVAEFDHLGAMGERALELGDPETASRLLAEALRTWRGTALVDVEVGPLIAAELRFLEGRRLTLHELRIDAELQLGKHAELLGELAAMTSEHPLNERLCEQRMIALCRSGRRSDALACYQRIREHLIDELGLEPGPALRRVQHAVLDADPELERAPQHRQLLPR